MLVNTHEAVGQAKYLPTGPSDEDNFDSHGPIAHEIVTLIRRKDLHGKTIGIEGEWGSGKSSIIRMIKRLLDSKGETVIVYDAWAHQGDPLRRAFLAHLVEELTKNGWLLNTGTWEEILQKLNERQKTSTTKILPELKPFGKFFAFLLLIVMPFGLGLMGTESTGWYWENMPFIQNWKYVYSITIFQQGLALALLPVFAMILRAICLFLLKLNWLQGPQPLMKKFSEAFAFSFDETFDLFSQGTNQIQTSMSTETLDATSIEFRKHFINLIEEVTKFERKLIVVIDNLDRIPADDMLAMWSTLRIFLEHSEHLNGNDDWRKNLWVLVPYDQSGIFRNIDASTHKDPEELTRAFIDKTFDIRVYAPPLVLKNWETFLKFQLKEAFSEVVNDDNTYHKVYRVYQKMHYEEDNPPTPREIILFINELASLYSKWPVLIPLEQKAYFVCLRRGVKQKSSSEEFTWKKLVSCCISGTLPFKPVEMFDENIFKNVASLYFNLHPDEAIHILLSNQIGKDLKDSNLEDLLNLSTIEGFWPVFVREMESFLDMANAGLLLAAKALAETELYKKNEKKNEHQETVCNLVLSSLKHFKQFERLDSQSAEYICSLVKIASEWTDFEALQKIIECLSSTHFVVSNDNINQQITDWASGFLRIMSEYNSLSLFHFFEKGIQLNPGNLENWAIFCREVTSTYPDEYVGLFLKPELDPSKTFNTIIDEGKYGDEYYQLLRVQKCSNIQDDYSSLMDLLAERLTTVANTSNDERQAIYSSLMLLRHLTNNSKALTKVANSAAIFDNMQEFYNDEDNEMFSQCLFLYLSNFQKMPSSYSFSTDEIQKFPQANDGKSTLVKVLGTPKQYEEDRNIADRFISFIEEDKDLPSLFNISDEGEPFSAWIQYCLEKIVVNDTRLVSLLPSDTFMDWWHILDEEPVSTARSLREIITVLILKSDLTIYVMGENHSFDIDHAQVYALIAKSDEFKDESYYKWCENQVNSLDKDAWISSISEDDWLIEIPRKILGKGYPIKIGINLRDALSEIASNIADDESNIPENFAEIFNDLKGVLTTDHLTSLQEGLLKILAQNETNNEFFRIFDEDLRADFFRATNPDYGVTIWTRAIENREVETLTWLLSYFENTPKALSGYRPNHKTDLRDRLTEALKNPVQDEAQEIINQIATASPFRIKVQSDNPPTQDSQDGTD